PMKLSLVPTSTSTADKVERGVDQLQSIVRLPGLRERLREQVPGEMYPGQRPGCLKCSDALLNLGKAHFYVAEIESRPTAQHMPPGNPQRKSISTGEGDSALRDRVGGLWVPAEHVSTRQERQHIADTVGML